MFNATRSHDRLSAAEKYADQLHALGVVSDEELAEVRVRIDAANTAHTVAANAESVRLTLARQLGEDLAGTEVDGTQIIEAANRLHDQSAVDLVAGSVYDTSARAAFAILHDKRVATVQALNKRLADIRAEVEKLAPVVGPLEDASAAIRAKKTKEWSSLEDLTAEHAAVTRLASELRIEGLIPALKARGYDGYSLVKHPDTPAEYPHLPPHRKALIDIVKRVSWVPADDAEIEAVRAADETVNA